MTLLGLCQLTDRPDRCTGIMCVCVMPQLPRFANVYVSLVETVKCLESKSSQIWPLRGHTRGLVYLGITCTGTCVCVMAQWHSCPDWKMPTFLSNEDRHRSIFIKSKKSQKKSVSIQNQRQVTDLCARSYMYMGLLNSFVTLLTCTLHRVISFPWL